MRFASFRTRCTAGAIRKKYTSANPTKIGNPTRLERATMLRRRNALPGSGLSATDLNSGLDSDIADSSGRFESRCVVNDYDHDNPSVQGATHCRVLRRYFSGMNSEAQSHKSARFRGLARDKHGLSGRQILNFEALLCFLRRPVFRILL